METRTNPFATLAALMLGTMFLLGIGFGVYIAISRGMLTLPPAHMTVNDQTNVRPTEPPFGNFGNRGGGSGASNSGAVNQQPVVVPTVAPAAQPQAQPAQQPAQAAPEQEVQVQREILSIQQVPLDQPDATPVEVRRVIITTTNQPGDETIVSDRGTKRKTGRP